MKLIYSTLLSALILAGCETQTEDSDNPSQLFEENSKTVMAFIEGYQNESLDYDALYSKNFKLLPTSQGSGDSATLDEIKDQNKRNWAVLDFKLLTDSVILLPGVSPETKLPDGSVRYYGVWEVTIPATDSTEARSATIKMYESFDFDDEGKIAIQQFYGDIGGLVKALFEKEDDEDEDKEGDDA